MSSQENSVRIGPVSMFTLIAVVCLSVLAVLAVTTANASYNMAKLQGDSVTQQYAAEDAAQRFVAAVDQHSRGTTGSAETRIAAVESSLDAIVAQTQQQTSGSVTVSAQVSGTDVLAQFACANGRTLKIVLTVLTDGNFQVNQWDMTATENTAQSENLWSGM